MRATTRWNTMTYSFEPVEQYAEPVPSRPIEDSLLTVRIIEALLEAATCGRWQDARA